MSEGKRPEGRPSKYKATYCDLVIEHMAAGRLGSAICPDVTKEPLSEKHIDGGWKWVGVRETAWCAFAMERQMDWLPSLGINSPFDRYELEVRPFLGGSKGAAKSSPRLDAVAWRGNKATLIEAKVSVSPASMMAGVGQLLYYKQVCSACNGWEVDQLVLISPAWPANFVETVQANKLPVDLVKVSPEMVYAYRSGEA